MLSTFRIMPEGVFTCSTEQVLPQHILELASTSSLGAACCFCRSRVAIVSLSIIDSFEFLRAEVGNHRPPPSPPPPWA